jgi:hypothetical protein
MRITDMRKLVYSLVATLFLAATAIGQNSSESGKCQPIGGFISTNVGGFGPNTTLGSVLGDLAGGIGVEILKVTTGGNGLVDVTVHHHLVTTTGDALTVNEAHLYGVYVVPGLLAVAKYKVHIAGGTGQYQNASGNLNVIGELDLNTNHTALQFTGQLCRGRDGED